MYDSKIQAFPLFEEGEPWDNTKNGSFVLHIDSLIRSIAIIATIIKGEQLARNARHSGAYL